MKQLFSGIILSALLGLIAMLIAPYIPMANSIVLALFIGILVTNTITLPKKWENGIHFSGKTLLEWAIIFLGFGISFSDITSVGLLRVGILVIAIIGILLITYFLSKKDSNPNTSLLIGFGTAICGSSAIAALAPKIKASKSETGIAIAVINLMGLIGMLGIPFVFDQIIANDTAALLIGGTLHGVSNVAGAGYAMNESVGDLSLTIKLARVALLAPSLIFFNMLINHHSTSIKENLKLPYYIIGFIGASTLISVFDIPELYIDIFRNLGKFLLTVSMAAIGLNIQFRHLLDEGKSALKFGAIIFMILIALVGALSFLL